jgi:hypothetical protein
MRDPDLPNDPTRSPARHRHMQWSAYLPELGQTVSPSGAGRNLSTGCPIAQATATAISTVGVLSGKTPAKAPRPQFGGATAQSIRRSWRSRWRATLAGSARSQRLPPGVERPWCWGGGRSCHRRAAPGRTKRRCTPNLPAGARGQGRDSWRASAQEANPAACDWIRVLRWVSLLQCRPAARS